MACPEGQTKDGFETQFGTNHLAHFLLFQLLKPALLSATTPEFSSRVVSVSSSGHASSTVLFDDLELKKQGYDKWAAYGQSKTANIWLANEVGEQLHARNTALVIATSTTNSALQLCMVTLLTVHCLLPCTFALSRSSGDAKCCMHKFFQCTDIALGYIRQWPQAQCEVQIERRYGAEGLHATSLHPGGIFTPLARHLSEEDINMFKNPEMQRKFKNPEQGAATTVWAAISPEWEGRGGKYLEDCQESQLKKGNEWGGRAPHAYDVEGAKRLWDVSLKLVGLQDV